MDGTLIKENSWDLIYKSVGLDTSPYLKDYLDGKISYEKLVELDVQYWRKNGKDVNKSMIEELTKRITIRDDALIVSSKLKKHGIHLVMVTAGLYEFAARVGRELKFDQIYANKFVYDERGFIKKAIIEVEPLHKYRLVERYLKEKGLTAEEAISVGDTIYDESMFKATARGFLLNDNYAIVNQEKHVIKSLTELLNYLSL